MDLPTSTFLDTSHAIAYLLNQAGMDMNQIWPLGQTSPITARFLCLYYAGIMRDDAMDFSNPFLEAACQPRVREVLATSY